MIVQLIVFHVVLVKFQNKLSLRNTGRHERSVEVPVMEKELDQSVLMNSSILPRAVLKSLRETA